MDPRSPRILGRLGAGSPEPIESCISITRDVDGDGLGPLRRACGGPQGGWRHHEGRVPGLDKPWAGWRRGDVHAGDLAGRSEPDPAQLRHERVLPLDRRRRELGADPLSPTDIVHPGESRLAPDRSRHRLRGRRLGRLAQDHARPRPDLDRRARLPRTLERRRDRSGTAATDARGRRAADLAVDRRRHHLGPGRVGHGSCSRLPLRSDQPC